ncbi:hypothetical protein MP228_012032 [Amoeboaphelidium protococcarum]|nr:hypothetical protein MP228_012032 [Amoeboaphelidium protococcarum]
MDVFGTCLNATGFTKSLYLSICFDLGLQAVLTYLLVLIYQAISYEDKRCGFCYLAPEGCVVLRILPSVQEPQMIDANYASVINIGKAQKLLLRDFTRIYGRATKSPPGQIWWTNFAGFLVIYNESSVIYVQYKLAQSVN